MKFWRISFYTLGIIPLGFIISLLAFYFNATKILGHFPSYENPDPKELSIYDSYSSAITFTFELWAYSILIWLLLLIAHMVIKRKETDWKLIIKSGLGHLCAILLFFSEITLWFAD